MPKLTSLIVAAAALALLASPAMAKHVATCYDFAWESQEQKDCLAHPEMMEHHHHAHHMTAEHAEHKAMHHKHKAAAKHGKNLEEKE
jgi:hypothetical protein